MAELVITGRRIKQNNAINDDSALENYLLELLETNATLDNGHVPRYSVTPVAGESDNFTFTVDVPDNANIKWRFRLTLADKFINEYIYLHQNSPTTIRGILNELPLTQLELSDVDAVLLNYLPVNGQKIGAIDQPQQFALGTVMPITITADLNLPEDHQMLVRKLRIPDDVKVSVPDSSILAVIS